MEYQSGAVRPIGSIEEGWSLIKNDYWTFFGMTLVAFVILIVASMILGMINNGITYVISSVLVGQTSSSNDAVKVSASLLPQILSMIVSFFTNIIVGTISGALFCGIYKALSRKANGGAAEFGDLFAGFQNLQACLIVALFTAVVQFILGFAMLLGGAAVGVSAVGLSGLITKDGQLNPSVFGGLFAVILVFAGIFIVVNLVISVLTTFVYPLIAERNLSGGQALMLSIKSGLSNFGGLLLLLILLGLMALGGALVCLVGIFFVAPILSAAMFAAYRSVFGATGSSYQQNPPPPPVFGNQPGY